MARQNGVPWITDVVQSSETLTHSTTRARPYGPAQKEMDETLDQGVGTGGTVGTRHNIGGWAFTGVRRNGVLPASSGNDLIFERVWVEPIRVDAGFITEELTYDISIWNAYQERSVEFTSISSVAPTGTSLPTPALPLDIQQSDDVVLTLTIDQTGPPIQDTYYKPLIDGVLYSIYITGIRVLGFFPEPTWEKGVQITYGFQTAMFQTERFEEQRRALMDTPHASLKATFPIYSRDAHQLFYDLSYGHDKLFGVPIYNESMGVSSIASATITTTDAVDNLYYLNNLATHVIIVDHGNKLTEIKEISSITPSNTIVCTQAVVESFTAATTRVYPIFFGLVKGVRSGHVTDDVVVVELEFEEFDNG